MEFTQEQKLYAEIVQKAWEDENFKKELVANPLEAIENLTGKKLNIPEGKTLVVRDQTAKDTVYINIPSDPKKIDDLELNESQLEAVAGGVTQPGAFLPTVLLSCFCSTGPTIPEQPTTNY